MLSWLVHQSRYERQIDAFVTASMGLEPVLSCLGLTLYSVATCRTGHISKRQPDQQIRRYPKSRSSPNPVSVTAWPHCLADQLASRYLIDVHTQMSKLSNRVRTPLMAVMSVAPNTIEQGRYTPVAVSLQ